MMFAEIKKRAGAKPISTTLLAPAPFSLFGFYFAFFGYW